MQIKQILVSVCSLCFLSVTMSSFAAGTSPEIDTRPLLRIGYIESSFSPFERKGFQDTFEYLQRELPQYRIRIQNFLVTDLEMGVRNKELELFIRGEILGVDVAENSMTTISDGTVCSKPAN